MGAGARFAAERDRWPEHWRVADLDMEEDGLLDLLEPAEELRAAIPGMRSTPQGGAEQVLVGVTDRRVVLVRRRHHPADGSPVRVLDVTRCASMAPHGSRVVPHHDGNVAFDSDDEAIARLWSRIEELDRLQQAVE